MRRTLFVALFALAASGCDRQENGGSSPSGYSVGEDERIIVSVDGREVPEARLQAYAPPGTEMNEDLTRRLIDNITISELLSSQAAANNLADSVEIREKLEVARQTVLSQALIEKLVNDNNPSEEELKERYAEMVGDFEGQQEYKARHILVEEEDEAREIIAELEEDMDRFGEIAREKSKDPGSGQQGGDLGWATPETYVQEFSEAMVALAAGELGREPVQSSFGWHIIALDEVRDVAVPEFDEAMRARITGAIQNEMVSNYIDNLRNTATIEVFEE